MLRLLLAVLLLPCVSFAQDWKNIHLTGIGNLQAWATSELSHPDDEKEDYFSIGKRYGVFKLFDNDTSTAWVEGERDSGTGVSVYIRIPGNLRRIEIFNGYGRSKYLWERNNRVKNLNLTVYIGIHPEGYVSENGLVYLAKQFQEEVPLDLKDYFGMQSVEFPLSWEILYDFRDNVIAQYHNEFDMPFSNVSFIIKFEITGIYKGSTWDDTCISELGFISSYLPGTNQIPYPLVNHVYIDGNRENRILADIPEENGIVLLEDENSVLQLMEYSEDRQWITVIRMPSEIGTGRTETEWMIINAMLSKIMNPIIEKTENIQLEGPFFLISRDGKLYLEHVSGEIILN